MKNKNKKNTRNNKKIIDLRRFFETKMVMPDENGSYTGMPAEYYYDSSEDSPVQDADDL